MFTLMLMNTPWYVSYRYLTPCFGLRGISNGISVRLDGNLPGLDISNE